MKTCNVMVRCEHGLHMRVAAQVVKRVQAHDAVVHIRCATCPWANACSVMELLMLGAAMGTRLEVVAEGPDEKLVLNAVAQVFSDGCGI